MKRELELYLVGCTDDEMERFIRFVLDISCDALPLIYDECGPAAKRKIAENSSKRMNAILVNPKERVPSPVNYPELEEKCLSYFQSEDFREYRELKVKSVLDVMKTMRKKGFPEKYISTFRLARYIDKEDIHQLLNSWFHIFLLEEALGFPMDTIMPVFKRKDSYSCLINLVVLLDNEEVILGELNEIPVLRKKKEEFATVRDRLILQHGENQAPEMPKWHEKFVYVYKKYYEETERDDLALLYKIMHRLGNKEVAEGRIPEGSHVNVWAEGGFYYQFCFYKEFTLMRFVNPFNKTDTVIVNEEQGREMDMTLVNIYAFLQRGLYRMGKPEVRYKRFGLTCKDRHFGTINGD